MSKPSQFTDSIPSGIALFDLDGTLLAWDTQILFRHWIVRHEPWRMLLLPFFLALAPFTPLLKDQGMKRVFLCFTFGISKEQLTLYAQSFAKELEAAFYKPMLEKLDTHRLQGDLTILTSASPEIYVEAIANHLGFDIGLGTETPNLGSHFFPYLTNHKGAEKVKRLHKLLPQHWWLDDGKLPQTHAYSDSCADLPMLKLAQKVTLINPSAALTRIGEASNWEILRPERPWKSSFKKIRLIIKHLLAIGPIIES